MRRIESWQHFNGPTAMRVITERDYRLLLAVARAAEEVTGVYRYGMYDEKLVATLDRLNARPKERKP